MVDTEVKMTRERIEELAAELHEVYMKEATRQGDVRHAEDYSELPENIKEFDRALARFILSRERLLLEKIGKPLMEASDVFDNALGDTDPQFDEEMTDEEIAEEDPMFYACQKVNIALAIIEKEGL
jgi:hypothetical protein